MSSRSRREARRRPPVSARSCREARRSRRVPPRSRRLSPRSPPVSPAGSRETRPRPRPGPRRRREVQRSRRAAPRSRGTTRPGWRVSSRSCRQTKWTWPTGVPRAPPEGGGKPLRLSMATLRAVWGATHGQHGRGHRRPGAARRAGASVRAVAAVRAAQAGGLQGRRAHRAGARVRRRGLRQPPPASQATGHRGRPVRRHQLCSALRQHEPQRALPRRRPRRRVHTRRRRRRAVSRPASAGEGGAGRHRPAHERPRGDLAKAPRPPGRATDRRARRRDEWPDGTRRVRRDRHRTRPGEHAAEHRFGAA